MVLFSEFARQAEVALLDSKMLKIQAINEVPFFSAILQISSSVFTKFTLLPCGGRYITNKLIFLVTPLKVTESFSMSLLITDRVFFALRPLRSKFIACRYSSPSFFSL